MTIEDVWPLFGLRIETPRLVLRVIRDEDLEPLAAAAIAGIHPPARMPFGVAWTDAVPTTLRRSLAQFHWRNRASLTTERWSLGLAVFEGGELVGVQDLLADRFAVLRTVSSGSWLTTTAQGRGIGTEMRSAVLQLAFDHLGAEWTESGAVDGNAASMRVSERLGYRPNGVTRLAVTRTDPLREEVLVEHRLRLARDEFVRPEWTAAITLPSEARQQLLGPPFSAAVAAD